MNLTVAVRMDQPQIVGEILPAEHAPDDMVDVPVAFVRQPLVAYRTTASLLFLEIANPFPTRKSFLTAFISTSPELTIPRAPSAQPR